MNIEYKFLRLFTHQMLDHEGKPNGVHFGCDNRDVVKRSHIDGETSPVIHEWVDTGEVYRLEEEIETLEAQRDALLEALRAMLEQFNYHTITGIVHDESAAIAKALAACAAVEGGK